MALKSQGSTLLCGNGASPEVFAALEECNSISGPDGSANLIDTTHLLSTGKEYLQGIADMGKIQLDCNFTGGTKQMALRTAFASAAPAGNFKLKIRTAATTSPLQYHIFAFQAIVSAWSLSTPTDDKAALSISLQITGSVSYSTGA